MKILVFCQYYYPEPVRIKDICEELVKKGNKVTVITDIPNYPMGEYYQGYDRKNNRNEIVNGVEVHRCFTIPRKKGILWRFLNYYSFSISSRLYARKIKEDYDVIFVNQLSPVMMANGGITYKKKHNKKLILYCLDIWPESLTAGGIRKNSLIFKYYHYVSKKIYTACDKILITSKAFEAYFIKEFNIDKNKIKHLPQYAEAIFDKNTCKKKADKNINLLFAGNIGKAQSMDTIINAANELKNIENLYFHIVGDGAEYQHCIDKIKNLKLSNVVMHGRKPLEDMPEYYKMADAMLVTLSGDSLVSTTLPGKVQTYMAAGKPIIGAANGETKTVIEESKCGYCGKADNYKELSNNIKKFIKSKDKEIMSENSYEFYLKNYDKNIFFKVLIEELNKKDGKNE